MIDIAAGLVISMVRKTVYFEERYGVTIGGLTSIAEVDACVEEKTGVKLKVVAASSGMMDRAGNVLNVKSYDIDRLIDMALR